MNRFDDKKILATDVIKNAVILESKGTVELKMTNIAFSSPYIGLLTHHIDKFKAINADYILIDAKLPEIERAGDKRDRIIMKRQYHILIDNNKK